MDKLLGSPILLNSSMSESALSDFVANYSSGSYIKDSKNGNFIVTNEHFLNFFGKSKVEEVTNLNVHGLDKFMRPFWGNNYAKEIVKMDNEVITKGEVVVKDDNIILNAHNEVFVGDMIKFPLIGRKNKIIAILSIINDLTPKIDLLRLFGLYKTMC